MNIKKALQMAISIMECNAKSFKTFGKAESIAEYNASLETLGKHLQKIDQDSVGPQEEVSVDCKIDSSNKSLEDQLEGICVLVNKTQAEKLLKAVELCTCYIWSDGEDAPTKFIPKDDTFYLYFDYYGSSYELLFDTLISYEGQPLTEFDKVMQIFKDFCNPCQ